jgi:hypothetical protein
MTGNVGKALSNASAVDAQLILSLLVWPEDCPDPRVVDAWLRRQEAGLQTDCKPTERDAAYTPSAIPLS